VSGIVIWFVGLPASGKSTLAQRFRARLVARNAPVIVLDGDVVRTILGAHDYSDSNRDELYRILADLAAMLAAQDVVVLVAATAPKRAHRAHARGLGAFVEVWVRASIAECRARDYKGLYAAADRGEIVTLPGLGTEFERPMAPEVVANGGLDDTALDRLDGLVTARA
jgi:adenylylsulfate kinase